MKNIKRRRNKKSTEKQINKKIGEIKKRGRPKKRINESVSTCDDKPKRKRGRPRKEIDSASNKQKPKARRGRPPKSALGNKRDSIKLDSPTNQKQTKVVNKYDSEFEARLFIGKKPSSKQLPEFDTWNLNHKKLVESNLFESQVNSIKVLEKMINGNIDSGLFNIDIPPIVVSKGNKITFVLFDPFDRGAEILIRYKNNAAPIGAANSTKQTVVCNKITDMIQKFLPVGVCC